MTNFKVSIIIPCYNAEKWIKNTLLSALHQDYSNIEVIYVDNESTDNSMKIAAAIQKEYPNLIIEQEDNIYPNCWDEPRRKGFQIATGDYFFTLAADDFYEKDYVSNCMRYISAAPDRIKVFQSALKSVSSDHPGPMGIINHTYNSIQEFKNLCMHTCPVTSPTVVYRRDLYDSGALSTFPEKYSGAADYDLYCRLADASIFIYPAGRWLGYNYRWHPEQATWDMHKDPVNYDKSIQDYWGQQWNK